MEEWDFGDEEVERKAWPAASPDAARSAAWAIARPPERSPGDRLAFASWKGRFSREFDSLVSWCDSFSDVGWASGSGDSRESSEGEECAMSSSSIEEDSMGNSSWRAGGEIVRVGTLSDLVCSVTEIMNQRYYYQDVSHSVTHSWLAYSRRMT